MKNLETEKRNPKTKELDLMEVSEILKTMNEEDATIPLAIREVIPEITLLVKWCIEAVEAGGRIIYAGAGTSGRLALIDAVETVPTFNVPPGMFYPIIAGGREAVGKSIEAVEDSSADGEKVLLECGVNEKDIVIGISASGRTPFVKGIFNKAHENGAKAALICNVSNPELEQYADLSIKVITGAEVVSGSTRLKAGTAQKLVLNMISTATLVKSGKVFGNLMVDVQTLNEKLKFRAVNIVTEATGASEEIARDRLVASRWNSKNAILQILLEVDAQKSEELLKKHKGFIRRALEG